MKIRSTFKKALATIATIGTAVVTLSLSLPSNAQDNGNYYCDTTGNNPVTVRQAGTDEFVFISWESDYGAAAGFSQERRCQLVTNKLNQNFRNNSGYFVPGISGNDAQAPGLPVVCASSVRSGLITCPSARILWTLPRGVDPNTVIAEVARFNDPTYTGHVRANDPLETYNGAYNLNVRMFSQYNRPYNRNSYTEPSPGGSENCTRNRLGACI